ncbi:MAG: type II toxin-antitoxin system RelE/ParE family toxin [Campylobacterales bacterium]|nr:type II toxin-antitoxin system RelE/ParE family toxin [Campylobacterales bacterium]
MNYKLIPTPSFAKSVKQLHKKYKQIGKDLLKFEEEIQKNEDIATNLGSGCFKARIPNSSISTGKSGGFRVVYYKRIENKIYLLLIYSKTDLENVKEERIIEILKENQLLEQL